MKTRRAALLAFLLAVATAPRATAAEPEVTWYVVATAYTIKGDVATAHTSLREVSAGTERVLKTGSLEPELSQGAGALWFSDYRGIIKRTSGGVETRITIGTDGDPSPSPDGSQLVFARVLPNGQPDLFLVNTDGTGLRRLTYRTGSQPSWGSNGAISFTRTVAGNQDVYVTDAQGAEPRRLTYAGTLDGRAAWSPDGTELAFQRGDAYGSRTTPDIYVVTYASGSLRRLTYLGGQDPSWPRADVIGFLRRGLQATRPDGTGLQSVPTHGGFVEGATGG